jgi:hypothetical protein
MKTGILILAGALLCGPAVASDHAAAGTAATPIVVTGEVLRFEPGRLLVLRASDGRETTFTLTPALAIPAEVQVGRTVSVHSEPGAGGMASVTKVTTTSVTPEGQLKQTTEETRTSPAGDVQKKTTTVVGNVVSFEPGKTIVVRKSTGESVTFELAPSAVVPADVQVGKQVTLYTMPAQQGGGTAVVSRVTTTSMTPEGDVKTTTEETRREPSGATTRTTTTSVKGKVQTFTPGKTITLIKEDGSAVTFTVPERARVAPEVAVGKTVSITMGPDGSVVETIVVQPQ